MLTGLLPSLSDELKMIQDTVTQFAQNEIAPRAEEIDHIGHIPPTLWQKMGELGLLGLTAESDYGGSAMGYLAHVIVMEALSRASASLGLSYGAHSNLCVNQITLNGTEAQKKQYLPKLISGEHVGALAMSETGAGSDVIAMQLRAEKKGDRYILNGHKMWITNGPQANVIIVYAKTDPLAGKKGITAFMVENTFKGFSIAQKLDKLGMRGSSTCELVFNDCEVPVENVLGIVNQGTKVLMRGLDYERVILAAGPVGIMQACLDVVLPYVQQRKQFNKAIGEFQLIQAKLADMYSTLSACRLYLYAAAEACDNKKSPVKMPPASFYIRLNAPHKWPYKPFSA